MPPTETAEIKPVAPVGAPIPPPKLFVIEPPLGWPIHWYPNGNPTEPPMKATCIDAPGRGLINLEYTEREGTRGWKRGVPHISDPAILLRRNRENLHAKGAWDWIPELVPPRFVGISRDEVRIITLYQRHRRTCADIAELMQGQWTSARVSGVLQKYHCLDKDTFGESTADSNKAKR